MSRLPIRFLIVISIVTAAAGCASERKAPPEALAASKAVENSIRQDRDELLSTAQTSLQGGDVKAAIERYQRVLRTDPDNADARYGLAEALLKADQYDDAIRHYRKLTDHPQHRAGSLQGLGMGLLLKGEAEEGQKALSAAVGEDPSLWRVWNALGQNWDHQKEWQRAEACYRKALAINPNADVVYNNLGMSYFMQAEYRKAVAQFNRALRLNKKLDAARLNRRLALAMLGRYDEAIEGVDQSDQPRVLNNIGYIAMLRGDLQLARAYFQQAIELSPSYYPKAHDNLRRVEELMKRRRKS
ncbi:MAG: tetratricopeptide repeat protein [Alphaproteobacteria bacterium]